MGNPFRNRITDAEQVSLVPKPDSREVSLTIRHPETLSPVSHWAPHYDPYEHIDELRQRVVQRVAELASSGGLDQENLNVLFHDIGSWRATWELDAQQQAEGRRKVAGMLLAQLSQNLDVEQQRLQTTMRRRDELRLLRDGLHEQLGFSVPVDDPAALDQLFRDRLSVSRQYLTFPRTPAADSRKEER